MKCANGNSWWYAARTCSRHPRVPLVRTLKPHSIETFQNVQTAKREIRLTGALDAGTFL
jgi:hypothetical protein